MKAMGLAAALAAAGFAAGVGGAAAQGADTIRLAQQLGAVLAVEEPCGLAYDGNAVAAWIEAHVGAADMGFTPMLTTMTRGARLQFDGMTATQQAAHCAQTRRVAAALRFIAP